MAAEMDARVGAALHYHGVMLAIKAGVLDTGISETLYPTERFAVQSIAFGIERSGHETFGQSCATSHREPINDGPKANKSFKRLI